MNKWNYIKNKDGSMVYIDEADYFSLHETINSNINTIFKDKAGSASLFDDKIIVMVESEVVEYTQKVGKPYCFYVNRDGTLDLNFLPRMTIKAINDVAKLLQAVTDKIDEFNLK